MMDCSDCKHNSYHDGTSTRFVSCGHPVTLAKQPNWQKGDPAWVNQMTADMLAERVNELGECPTWEPISAATAIEDIRDDLAEIENRK